jgi:NAD(P)H-flavin reductase
MALVEQQAVLTRSVEIGPAIRWMEFKIPAAERFDFIPGQWVSIYASIHGKIITRAYSLASQPSGNRFEICLNLVPDGHFSPFLFGLQPGNTVFMKGPVGNFTFRESGRPAVFVATGTGVVPFRSMLGGFGAIRQGYSKTLLFGARHEAGLMFREEFAALSASNPLFHFVPTLTRPEPHWNGATGRVQPLLWEILGDSKDVDIYICGLKVMVDDVREQLKQRGFDRKQIIYEKYD